MKFFRWGNKEDGKQDVVKAVVEVVDREKRIPIKPYTEKEGKYFMRCPKCGGVHFRHTGYIETVIPYSLGEDKNHVSHDSLCVKTCVKCRSSFIFNDERFVEVTDQIDLKAWEKFENESIRATGPGGEC